MPGIGLGVEKWVTGLVENVGSQSVQWWTGGELGRLPAFREGGDVWFLFPWSNKI